MPSSNHPVRAIRGRLVVRDIVIVLAVSSLAPVIWTLLPIRHFDTSVVLGISGFTIVGRLTPRDRNRWRHLTCVGVAVWCCALTSIAISGPPGYPWWRAAIVTLMATTFYAAVGSALAYRLFHGRTRRVSEAIAGDNDSLGSERTANVAGAASRLPQMRLTPDEGRANQTGTEQVGSSYLPGVSTKVLAGDPSKPGFYTIILSVPARLKIDRSVIW
jgi:hypothetical protein